MAEYALLLGVITLALILVVQQFGGSVGGIFSRTGSTLATATEGEEGGGRGGPPCGTPPCGRGPDGEGPPGQLP